MCMNLRGPTTRTISLGAAAPPEDLNTLETHQWQTRLAVILLVSALILHSHTDSFASFYLLRLDSRIILTALNAIPYQIPTPLPLPSLSHAYHTFFFVSVCLYLLVSQVVGRHTGA